MIYTIGAESVEMHCTVRQIVKFLAKFVSQMIPKKQFRLHGELLTPSKFTEILNNSIQPEKVSNSEPVFGCTL